MPTPSNPLTKNLHCLLMWLWRMQTLGSYVFFRINGAENVLVVAYYSKIPVRVQQPVNHSHSAPEAVCLQGAWDPEQTDHYRQLFPIQSCCVTRVQPYLWIYSSYFQAIVSPVHWIKVRNGANWWKDISINARSLALTLIWQAILCLRSIYCVVISRHLQNVCMPNQTNLPAASKLPKLFSAKWIHQRHHRQNPDQTGSSECAIRQPL